MAAHQVNRIEIELKAADAAVAELLLERTGLLHERRVAPMMDRLFTELSGPGRCDRLDCLEVDLGKVAVDDFEEDFVHKLEAALRAALMKSLNAHGVGDRTQAMLELIEAFARTGNLPWWVRPVETDPVRIAIATLASEAPGKLVALLRELAGDRLATARIARHCDEDSIERLMASDGGLERPAPMAREAAAQGGAGLPSPGEPRHEPPAAQEGSGAWQEVLATRQLLEGLAAGEEGRASRRKLALPVEMLLAAIADQTRPDQTRVIDAMVAAQAAALGWTERELWERLETVVRRPFLPPRLREMVSISHSADRLQVAVDTTSPPPSERRTGSTAVRSRTSDEPAVGATPSIDSVEDDGAEPSQHRIRRWRGEPPTHDPGTADRSVPPPNGRSRAPGERTLAPRGRPDPAQAARDRALERLDELHVEDAGLVIVWPFLDRFFHRLGLLDEKHYFIDEVAQMQAVALLGFLATEDPELPEFRLPLAKLVCGMSPGAAYVVGRPITPEQRDECERLLAAVISHVPILQDMPVASFRASFLQRHAVLSTRDGVWVLQVEHRPHDVVLERFPWSWTWVNLSWMSEPVQVEWS